MIASGAIVLFLIFVVYFIISKYLKYKKLIAKYESIPGHVQLCSPYLLATLPSFVQRTFFKHALPLFYDLHIKGTPKLYFNYSQPIVKVVSMDMGGVLYVNDPQFITFYMKNPKYFEKKSKLGTVVQELFGNNLFSSNGEDWKRFRGLMNPAFVPSALGCVLEAVTVTMKDWNTILASQPKKRDIFADLSRFTMDVIGLAGFSTPFHSFSQQQTPISQSFQTILHQVYVYYTLPFFLKHCTWIPTVNKITNAVTCIQSQIGQMIDQQTQNQNDILSLLLNASQSDYAIMTKQELIANCFVLLAAGFETTSRTLSFVLFHLAKYPIIQRKAQQVIDQVLVNSSSCTLLHLAQLEYVEWIICESMRMIPAAAYVFRNATQDFTYQGYTIPKGTPINFNNKLHLMNQEIWGKDVNEFKPERFEQHVSAFTAFGFGKRSCIGSKFAMMEMVLVCTLLLKDYSLQLESEEELDLETHFATTPKQPILISFVKRN